MFGVAPGLVDELKVELATEFPPLVCIHEHGVVALEDEFSEDIRRWPVACVCPLFIEDVDGVLGRSENDHVPKADLDGQDGTIFSSPFGEAEGWVM